MILILSFKDALSHKAIEIQFKIAKQLPNKFYC